MSATAVIIIVDIYQTKPRRFTKFANKKMAKMLFLYSHVVLLKIQIFTPNIPVRSLQLTGGSPLLINITDRINLGISLN
jgi:hypothetical protein